MNGEHANGKLLRPAEVADLFGVAPRTVTRWADEGKLTPLLTLGGHRRYRRSEVDDLLAEREQGHGQRDNGTR